jgi:hypothetical protein
MDEALARCFNEWMETVLESNYYWLRNAQARFCWGTAHAAEAV